jgi:hypothetical protein
LYFLHNKVRRFLKDYITKLKNGEFEKEMVD